MRILLWHGYLLGGTGSNVYTRQLAREWSRAGHDVTVFCQDPHPDAHDLGGAEVVRPDVGGLLPVFVLDRYEGYEVKLVQDCTREELERWVEANGAALRARLPADLVFCNHVLLGGPVGVADRCTLRGQGPRLRARVLDARPAGARSLGEGVARGRERGVRRLGPHPRRPRGGVRPRRPRPRGAARRGRRGVEAAPAGARRSPRCSRRRGATRRIPGARTSVFRTRATQSDSPRSSPGERPTVVYFGKLLLNKGVHVLLEAIEGLDARAVIVGFGDYREELEALADPGSTLFTGPLEHRHLVHLLALADACVVPSIFPEAFGMVAAEAAAAGCPPLVARHSGLAEVAEGLEAEYPPELRHLASFASGDAGDLRSEARSSCSRCPPSERDGAPRRGTARGGRALELGERRRAAAGVDRP